MFACEEEKPLEENLEWSYGDYKLMKPKTDVFLLLTAGAFIMARAAHPMFSIEDLS